MAAAITELDHPKPQPPHANLWSQTEKGWRCSCENMTPLREEMSAWSHRSLVTEVRAGVPGISRPALSWNVLLSSQMALSPCILKRKRRFSPMSESQLCPF